MVRLNLKNFMKEGEKNYKQIHRKLACCNTLFEVFFDKLKFKDYLVDNYLTVKPKLSHGPKKIVGI